MKLVETGSIPLSDIQIGDRERQLDESHAQGFAAMFQQSPMQNPIQLMQIGNTLRLIAGRHRMRAYEINGWNDIPAAIYKPSSDKPEDELKLAEIDENLGRNGLSILDRAAAITRRQVILKRLYGETRGRPSEKTAKFAGISISAEVAAKMNLSDRTIRAAVEMFNGLSAASRRRVTGTRLADNHVQLRQLSQLDAEHQHKALDLILAEEPKARNVNDAVCIIEKRPKAKTDNAKQLARLQKQYLSASKPVQREFQQWIDTLGQSVPKG